jgi:hypothetical protein
MKNPSTDSETILGFKGHLIMLQADPANHALIKLTYLDLKNPALIAQLKDTQYGWLPRRYQFTCDLCHMTTTIDHPEYESLCKFCNHKTLNANYPAWRRLKELMDKD